MSTHSKAVDAPIAASDRTQDTSNFNLPEPAGLSQARDDAFGIGALGVGMEAGKSGSPESSLPNDGVGTQVLDDIQGTALAFGDGANAAGGKILDANATHSSEVPNSYDSMMKDYGMKSGERQEGQTEAADKFQLNSREGALAFALDASKNGHSDATKIKVDQAFEHMVSSGQGLNYNRELYNPHAIFDENSWNVQKNTA